MDFSQVKLLWFMCVFEAQRFRAYPLEIVASLFSRLAEAALYATFWIIISQFGGGNISLHDIVGYYLIISGLTPFFYSGFGIATQAIEMIKSGELTQTLIRPVNPILYPWAVRTGRNLVNLLFGLVQVAAGMIISGGITPHALPFLLPVVLNTMVLNLSFNLMLGTLAFYFTEARNLKNVVYHITTFARGEKMPLYLMPPWLSQFLLLTPFPASQYHLAILLQGTRMPTWGDVLIGCAWSAVLLVLAIKFWQRGLRKYEAIGI